MNYTKLNYLPHILSLSLALIWLWIHNVMTPKSRQNQLHVQGSCEENTSRNSILNYIWQVTQIKN